MSSDLSMLGIFWPQAYTFPTKTIKDTPLSLQ